MKKAQHPLFTVKEFADFLIEAERAHAGLDVLMPEKKGWKLTQELPAGEQSPVLFRVYTKQDKQLVISSDYVNDRMNACSGASRTEWLRESDPKEKKKLKAHSWSQLIAQINAADFEKISVEQQHVHSALITGMICDLIRDDLTMISKSDDDALVAKDAGAAYQSGLVNFLVATGQRKKRGKQREGDGPLASIPWEFLAVKRAQQFVVLHQFLPSKKWLRAQLEQDGIHYSPEKSRDIANWSNLFERVGLSSLPA